MTQRPHSTATIEPPAPARLRLTGTTAEAPPWSPATRFSQSSLRALEAVEDVSRRIDHLAVTLGCLGHFDGTDGPRAA